MKLIYEVSVEIDEEQYMQQFGTSGVLTLQFHPEQLAKALMDAWAYPEYQLDMNIHVDLVETR